MSKKSELQNPLKPFKFRASKPLEPAIKYLQDYGANKEILMDPFAGSGAFILAGLLEGKQVIYNDPCPYALFLARNAIKPVDPDRIHKKWVEVLDRPIEKTIRTNEGEPLIPKGTSVEDAVKWFYKTEEGVADYFVWDTEFGIPKMDGDLKAREDKRYKLFIDKICEEEEIDGEKYYTYSQREINEKWEEVFDADPKTWLENSKYKRRKTSVITQFAGAIARTLSERIRRKPIKKKVKGDLKKLDRKDWEKIEEIEEMEIPYPDLIPQTKLRYENGENFHQLRYESILPNSVLSTVREGEPPLLKHFFTKRNLIALSLILWSIKQVEKFSMREQLYLIFASKLRMIPKFDRRGPYNSWATGYYQALNDFKENNPLVQFMKGFRRTIEAKKEVWKLSKGKLSKGITFDETETPKEFLDNITKKREKNILWLQCDARVLNKKMEDQKIVDLVFTDPPYKGKEESVQYYEVTTLYEGVLSLDEEWGKKYGKPKWWKTEVIQNKEQGKDFEAYIDLLSDCFSAVNKVTRQDAQWIVTYHSLNPVVWEGVRGVFRGIGLNPPPAKKIKTEEIRWGRSIYTKRYGSLEDDAYIVLSKKKEGIEGGGEISKKEFFELAINEMKKKILKRKGVVKFKDFTDVIPDIALKRGKPKGIEKGKDFKDLFKEATFELAPGYRVFDRDFIREETWKKIYYDIPIEDLLFKCLKLYGREQKNIPQPEMRYKILSKLNGRMDKENFSKVIRSLYRYDPVKDIFTYTGMKEPGDKSLGEYFSGKKEKEEKEAKLPAMPPDITSGIKKGAEWFGHKVEQDEKKSYNLKILIEGKETTYIFINNEAAVRRTVDWKRKPEKAVIFIYYPRGENYNQNIKNIKEWIGGIKFYAVPYEDWEQVKDAFEGPHPLDLLSKFLIE